MMIQYMSNIQSPIAPIQIRQNKWYQQQMLSCMRQYHNNTAQHTFEYFNNGCCQRAFRKFSDQYYRIGNIINNGDNNAVNWCCAPLIPNKQQVINNPTTAGDKNNTIADLRTVLKQLHNQTKQILISAVVDPFQFHQIQRPH